MAIGDHTLSNLPDAPFGGCNHQVDAVEGVGYASGVVECNPGLPAGAQRGRTWVATVVVRRLGSALSMSSRSRRCHRPSSAPHKRDCARQDSMPRRPLRNLRGA